MKRLYILFALTLLMASCQKDYELDYRPVEPFCIIEGSISDSPAEVLITYSREMTDSVHPRGIDGAEVRLSDDAGRQELLVYGADGRYHSPSNWVGETGRTYTLDVRLGEKLYSARSTMMPAASLDSIRFCWVESAGMKMMLLKCSSTLPEEGPSYTHTTVTRNGRFYRKHTFKQINLRNTLAEALIGCTTERKMEEDDPDDRDAILYEGDSMRVELWTIDRPVFDYLFSVKAGKQNACNPLPYFSGGAFGYFSAHHTSAIDTVFHFDEVQDM